MMKMSLFVQTEDYLKRKIKSRPERSELISMHILEGEQVWHTTSEESEHIGTIRFLFRLPRDGSRAVGSGQAAAAEESTPCRWFEW